MSKLGVGETLDTSFRIYRQQFGKLVGLSTLVSIPSALLFWMLMKGTGSMPANWLTTSMMMGRHSTAALEAMQPGFWAGVAGAGLLAGLLGLLVMGAISAVALSAIRGEEMSFGQSLGRGGRALPSLLVAGIVTAVLTGIGAFVCLVPGLIVATCFALFMPAIVAEGCGPFASLGRSSRLTQGERWSVFGVIVVSYFIIMIITYAFGAVFALLSRAMFGSNLTAAAMISSLGSVIPSILLTPLQLIPFTIMFVKLRDEKEATEFEYSVDRMLEGSPDGSDRLSN